MSPILTVIRKELRSTFQSPIALIFLGVFLLVTLYTFFSGSRFFARNIADVRPLFEWLPLLLIFLVSAITMRQWAEEQRAGTLEVLLTLPLRTRDLVLGKFFAAVLLVGLGLALTLPLPITVAALGDLDWGPVIGGYTGALLLGATYLAIGLCVSARTDNQVVALMVTLVVGGALYLIGTDGVTALFGNQGAEVLRAMGTGSRFESIERGVLDARDLAYYGSLTAFFLTLNAYFLESRRLDPGAKEGRNQMGMLTAAVTLTALNVVALNLWLAPVSLARIDLTADKEYSISQVTLDTLAALDEPMEINGYFSERTHPLLAPLIPQIRDLLAEYEVRGKGKVSVAILDPNSDEELEAELGEQYGIRSVPFRVSDRHSQAVVNSYFHLLIRYGDQYETLSFQDLVEVQATEEGVDVRLRNLEYDLTRTIKRVSQDFQSIESVIAKLPDNAVLTAYISAPDQLPKGVDANAELIAQVSEDLASVSAGKLTFRTVDPTGNPQLRQEIAEKYAVQPFAADLFGTRTFYFHLVITSGDKAERLVPSGDLTEADLRQALEAAIRRMTPGQLKTVAVATVLPEAPPPNPQMPPQMQPPPPRPDFRGLRQALGENYQVEPVDYPAGSLSDTVDVLVIGKTGALPPDKLFEIDQFLMRGGAVIAMVSNQTIEASRTGLGTKPVDQGLGQMLATYGVKVGDTLVMDPRNAAFPVPVQERRGAFTMERIELLPYPFFPDIRHDGYNESSPILAGIPSMTTPWASPLELVDVEGVESEVLLRTSPDSWTDSTGTIDPDFNQYPDGGFAKSTETSSQVVAVALSGEFPSAFGEPPKGAEGTASDHLKTALPGARLIVVGSSDLTSDIMLQLAQQPTGEVHRGNLQFVQNAIDWAVEDTDLLQIRTVGAFARTLRPMDDDERVRWELGNYGVVALALGLVAWLPRRRNITPLTK